MASRAKQNRRRSSRGISPAAAREHAPSAQGSGRRTFWALLVLAALLALALRILHVFQITATPATAELIGDARGYYDWAQRIAAGDWYGSETFYQAPLYPYLLAFIITAFGPSALAIRLAQCVLGSLAVALLGVAAKNLFSPRVGIAAAIGLAIYPPAIYYDALVQKASLASFLLCGLLAVLTSYAIRQNTRGLCLSCAGLAGIVLGLLILTRENALVWAPLIAVWFWLESRSTTGRADSTAPAGGHGTRLSPGRRLPPVIVYIAGVGLILVPVAARNASLGGEWSPTTFQAGPNFYIGNSAQANGVYTPLVAGHEAPAYERADAVRLAQEATGREMTPREVSRFWFDRALRDIRRDPAHWIKLILLKTAMVVNRYEVPDVESFYVQKTWSTPLRVLGSVWHFGILAPLAVLGLGLTISQARSLWIYYALIAAMILAIAMFFVLGRYRFPLVPLLLPLAAVLIDRWRDLIGIKKRRTIIAVTAACAAGLLCNLPLHDEARLHAAACMNIGIAAAQGGDLPTAVSWLERSVQLHPDSASAYFNLGGALAMSGRADDAIRALRAAKQRDPRLLEVDRYLAEVLEQTGQTREAIEHYRAALQLDPRDTFSRSRLAALTGQP